MTKTKDDLRMRLAGGILTPNDVRSMSADEVLDLKESVRYRSSLATIPEQSAADQKAVASGSGATMVFDGSTEHRDRMGDVIRVYGKKGGKGWQIDRYVEAGAPFLWAHDSSAPPVGRAVKVWRGKSSADKSVNALKFRVEFQESHDYPFANLVARMFLSRRMTGSSVGFVISKAERYSTQVEREKAGLGPNGIEVTEADLLELSGTPTPANPFALATAEKSFDPAKQIDRAIRAALEDLVSDGHVSKAQANEFRKLYPLGPMDAADRLRARIRGFVDFGGIERVKPDALKKGDFASWNSSGGRARGRVERIVRDGELAVPDTDFVITGTPENPAALLRVYDDKGRPTDVLVGHKFSTLTKIKPIEEPEEEERMTYGVDVEQRGRGRRKPKDEEEGKGDSKPEDEELEELEEDGKPMKPRKPYKDGADLVIPKKYHSRIRDAFESIQSLAADLDDLLDVLEQGEIRAADEPQEPLVPEAAEQDEKTCLPDLLSDIRQLVGELRESRLTGETTGGASVPHAEETEGSAPGAVVKATDSLKVELSDEEFDDFMARVRKATAKTRTD